MKLGFTGTREGMTDPQVEAFRSIVCASQPNEFHHGDCTGADAQAHELVRLHAPSCLIIIHPPIKEATRAFCQGDVILKADTYLKRDKHIAASSESLIATPRTYHEEIRSGTWSTVRYARDFSIPRIIILPDGELRILT